MQVVENSVFISFYHHIPIPQWELSRFAPLFRITSSSRDAKKSVQFVLFEPINS
jgi:hypothetical protein